MFVVVPAVLFAAGVVIVAVFAFAAYFYVVDSLVAKLLDKLMNAFTR